MQLQLWVRIFCLQSRRTARCRAGPWAFYKLRDDGTVPLICPTCQNVFAGIAANIGLSLYVRGEGIFVTNLGTFSSPRTFAGSGFGGQLFCVDPERELTFVHLVCGYPQLYSARKRSQRIADLIISSVVD